MLYLSLWSTSSAWHLADDDYFLNEHMIPELEEKGVSAWLLILLYSFIFNFFFDKAG